MKLSCADTHVKLTMLWECSRGGLAMPGTPAAGHKLVSKDDDLVVSTSHGQPNDPQRVASTGVRNDDPVERHQPRSVQGSGYSASEGRLSCGTQSQRTEACGSD